MVQVAERPYVDVARAVQDDLALDSAERYFDIVFDCAPVMLHSIDKDGRIVKVNGRWLVELTRDENADVRLAAFSTLATTRSPQMQAHVRSLGSQDIDPRIRRLAEQLDRGPTR